ncbi:hypothetical protein ABZY14_40860 [Streptomyces sp. NPDC006617]|uniref:hypothetical protein n=1 Tax=Streptomyces sp. NPDC006617 TaxID=3155354 RepID=UPI0033BF358B
MNPHHGHPTHSRKLMIFMAVNSPETILRDLNIVSLTEMLTLSDGVAHSSRM